MFNHIEYDTTSLADEYWRDRTAGKPIELPANYFPKNDPEQPPENRWRSHAHLLFGNWINEVYQTTPFDLTKIGGVNRRATAPLQASSRRRPGSALFSTAETKLDPGLRRDDAERERTHMPDRQLLLLRHAKAVLGDRGMRGHRPPPRTARREGGEADGPLHGGARSDHRTSSSARPPAARGRPGRSPPRELPQTETRLVDALYDFGDGAALL